MRRDMATPSPICDTRRSAASRSCDSAAACMGLSPMTRILADRRHLALVAVVCSLTSSAAQAQTRAPQSFPSASGQPVRIRLSGGGDVQGSLTVLDIRNGRLVLGAPARTVALAQVDSLWIRRDLARSGATIGGAAAGISMFVFTTSLCFTGTGCLASGPGDTAGARWRVVGISTVAATAAGAVAGGVAGRLLRRWVPVALP